MDINIESSQQAPTPIPTSNTLKDIINWIDNGDVVVLHINEQQHQYYHKCNTFKDSATRLIYVDVAVLPDLLHEGEWPYYIKNNERMRCNCKAVHSVTPQNTWRFFIPQ